MTPTIVVPCADEAGAFFVVRTRTDGDDGYAFVFDDAGRCQGAARTDLENCAWDSLDATLALLRHNAVPESLRRRPSLWLDVMRAKAAQR